MFHCLREKKAHFYKRTQTSIYRIPLLFEFPRSGWHLPSFYGVAVASQILCISTTLNKGMFSFSSIVRYNTYASMSRDSFLFCNMFQQKQSLSPNDACSHPPFEQGSINKPLNSTVTENPPRVSGLPKSPGIVKY